MINFIYTVVAFVVALGILITVHEFGHFWVARRLGVKVLRFSVGFGRPLWSRRIGRDKMELVIAAIPLGGYVKMLDETEGKVARHDLRRAFNRQPVWKRAAIAASGPAANFLFAILAYWLVFMIGVEGIKPVVGKVVEGSIAQKAGFRVGDEMLRIDGHEVTSWDQRRLYLFRRALDRATVHVVVRDPEGRERTRALDLTRFPAGEISSSLVERGIGLYGYFPEALPVIGVLDAGGAAARAGLRVGDRLARIDGHEVRDWEGLVALVSRSPGRALALTVEREGARLRVTVVPDAVEQDGRKIGRIGIRPRFSDVPEHLRIKVRHGPVAALVEGVDNTWSMSWLTLKMLYKMLQLEVSAKNISGPITIAQYAGYSAMIGAEQFIIFLAVISVSLAVLNLLPIPVLDGGHLLYFAIEAVRGRPLPERVQAWGQQIGVALLVALMLLAFYNDLTRIFR